MKDRETWCPEAPGVAESDMTEQLHNNNINLYFFKNHFLVLLHFSFHFKISTIFILSESPGELGFFFFFFFLFF